uniref:Uncharacterized protein n=1 Tax=Cacopsylla melanoneura TaxID=428564 RepID=A0A8D9BMI1_9HEMI
MSKLDLNNNGIREDRNQNKENPFCQLSRIKRMSVQSDSNLIKIINRKNLFYSNNIKVHGLFWDHFQLYYLNRLLFIIISNSLSSRYLVFWDHFLRKQWSTFT